MDDITKKINEVLWILNALFPELSPNRYDEVKKTKENSKKRK